MQIARSFYSTFWIAFVSLCAGPLIISPAQAVTNRTVCASGCDHTTIQAAINYIDNNDPEGGTATVTDSGTYSEHIDMKSGVNVVSAEGETPSIAYSSSPVVDFDGVTNCTLDGFDVYTTASSGSYLGLIHVNGASASCTDVTISNCTVRDNPGDHSGNGPGINLSYAASPTILGNTIKNNAAGGIVSRPMSMSCSACLEATGNPVIIRGNNIHNNGTRRAGTSPPYAAGIYLLSRQNGVQVLIGGSEDEQRNDVRNNVGAGIRLRYRITDATIENNYFYSNDMAGIYLRDMPGATVTVENNDIEENGGREGGGEPRGGGIRIRDVPQVFVKGNDIYNNFRAGIYVQDLDDSYNISPNVNITEGNVIRTNGYAPGWDDTYGGIYIQGANSVTIAGNKIYDNARAGIRNNGASSLTVIGNDIYENDYAGIRIDTGSGTIAQNNIYSNYVGIGFRGSGSPDYDIIKNNIYMNHTKGGIGIDPSSTATPSLTIRQNKVYGQTNTSTGGGIQVVSAGTTTIENNLVYENKKGGIRFGDSTTTIKNNTVVGNGASDYGGGIIHSDNDPPNVPAGTAPTTLIVRNNISTHNEKAGLRVGGYGDPDWYECPSNPDYPGDPADDKYRDFNLLYSNNGTGATDCNWYAAYPNKSCVNKNYGGCGLDDSWNKYNPNDIMADPLFVDKDNDNYHLQVGSPAVTDPGGDGTQRGCYGGQYPMHNLIDADTSTGNTSSGGTYIMFDLGASYTVTDVKLYGTDAYAARTWEVFVGTDPSGCDGAWGTSGGSWSVGGGAAPGWYEHTLSSSLTGQYIKLVSAGGVNENEVFELQYKEDTNTYWRSPSVVYDGTCTDISG